MEAKKDQFPAGLRVLVVDDDRTCLYIIDKMLRRCSYTVTTCGLARIALAMLRENKDKFDLVISDVYMPDMDGFKLLELVGLEMDLPVIMMSANGETSVVMKGITHGACDYLLKPIRMEELRNIWQHVVRKKRIASKDTDQSTSADEKINKRASDDCDPTMSTSSKRRKDVKEEDDDNDPESDDPSTLKKPRVVWSVELHQQFVNAVNRLGIEKAVPKRILELMNVQGLTRENVASHLQKYRLYLKRLSGAHHQNGMALSFGSVSDLPFSSVNVLDGLGDLRTHPVIGQTPNPAFTALHWAYLNRMCPTNSMSAPTLDSSALIQSAALQAASRGHVSRPQIPAVVGQASFLHSLGHDMEHNASGQITSFGHLRSPIDDVTGIHCAQNQIVTASGLGGLSTIGGMNCNSSSTINTTLMSQQQQHSQQAAALSTLPVGTTRQQLMPELSRGQLSSLCLKTGDLGSPSMKVNPLGLCGAVPHTEGLVNTCDMERNDAFGVLGSNCSESSDMSFNMVGVKTNNATAARDFNLDLEFQEDRKPYIKSPDMGRFGSPHKGNDQSQRAGWQGLNLNPGFSTTSSCSYPSVSIGGPNANVSASQVQVEADPLEDAKRTSSTSNRFYARGGQHVEQVMGKIKEECTLDSVINGFSTEQVLPDDILNFFFKQTCDNDSGNAVIQQDGYWRVPSTDGLFAVPEL